MDDKVIALQAAVDELRRDLDELRRARRGSMRDTHRCPACGGGQLLHFRRIKDVAQNGIVDFALAKQWDVWRWRSLHDVGGVLEAFACRACRLVEWHAISLDDVKPDGEDVVELTAEDPAPGDGPYR